MKTYLVTGGAGFIGSHFIRYLLQEYDDIHVVNVDRLSAGSCLENLAAVQEDPRYTFLQEDVASPRLESLLESHSFERIVNFAAETHVDRSIQDPAPFVHSNILGCANLLDLARKRWTVGGRPGGEVRFLQVSTDEVYGSLGGEGCFTEASPLRPQNPYAATKASADLLAASYGSVYGLPVIISRCTNNFGPGQYKEKLIPKVILSALSGQEIPLYGDGANIRDWLYVEDHVRALDTILRHGRPGGVYNVGGGTECTNRELAGRILWELRERWDARISPQLIQYVEDRPNHDYRYSLDWSRLREELGYLPKARFGQVLRETVDWYAAGYFQGGQGNPSGNPHSF